jgi:4-hydroxy-4-methyl-2-oxoglutarate aldolase
MATEAELATVRDRLLGLVDEERIARVEIPRPPTEVVEGFLALGDLSSTVSDVLDELGIGGCVGASVVHPLDTETRVCGPAITIRYGPEEDSVDTLIARGERARLAERDLYGIGRVGDVAVFDCDGFTGASVMGSLSARWARRLGIAGCVVDGAIRDVESILEVGIPVWSRGITPVSGKHRLQALELNGAVTFAGLSVEPGDIVLADAVGICIVPGNRAAEVLERCRALAAAEREVEEAIDGGVDPAEIARRLRPERW